MALPTITAGRKLVKETIVRSDDDTTQTYVTEYVLSNEGRVKRGTDVSTAAVGADATDVMSTVFTAVNDDTLP